MPRTLVAVAFFNPFRPAYAEDPYPVLARLRDQEPVHWSPDMGGWVLTRYDDCLKVLQDDERFSSDPASASGAYGEAIRARRAMVPLGEAPILGNSDPPDHTRLRTIVNRAFTPAAMDRMRPTVEAAVDHFFGQAHEGVPWDAVPGICEPLAITTILAHLGFPAEGWQPVRQWSAAIMRARAEGGDHPDVIRDAETARESLLDYIATIAERRDVPDEQKGPRDVLGALLDAVDDEAITPDEMLMMLIHISMAGNGPLAMSISNVIAALEQHPAIRSRLIDDPDLVPTGVEEILRWDSATHYVVRFALDDIKMWNRTIREGQMIYVMVGAANRDPDKFEEPDEIKLGRPSIRHLTFGMGIHYCLGTPLAKIELDVAIRRLLERWGEYRVVGSARGGSLQVRGYGKLELLPG